MINLSKIAVASDQIGGLDDQVSQIFGRCPSFTIVTIEDGEIKESKVVQNQHADEQGGAGIQAAGFLANQGIEVVIAGDFGPNVASVFNESDIVMAPVSGMSVRDAVKSYLKGNIDIVSQPTAAAKSGGGTGHRMKGRGRSKQNGQSEARSSRPAEQGSNSRNAAEDIEDLLTSIEREIEEVRKSLKELKE